MNAAALLLLVLLGPEGLGVPPLTGRVVDLAGLLDASAEAALADRLAAFEAETSNQVVVLTVPSLEGEVLEPFATRVYRAWGLGQAGRDNGVLVLLAREERKVRIEVGYGLEGALTDATAGHIIRSEMVPAFRAEDYSAGLLRGVDAVLLATEGEYVAEEEALGWLERLLLLGVVGLLPAGVVVTFVGSVGRAGWTGDALVLALGLVGGALLTIGVAFVIDKAASLLVLAVFPFGLLIANRVLERHPVCGPARRHRRAKQAAFRHARRRGEGTVVVDGRTYAVPADTGGSFSGGGGSSGGGGASGSW